MCRFASAVSAPRKSASSNGSMMGQMAVLSGSSMQPLSASTTSGCVLHRPPRLGLSFRMDRRDIKTRWKLAREAGTFLIPKHDPNELATPWRSYRTVLTHELSASLDTFLEGDAYELEWYENKMGDYFVVVPQSSSSFSVTASGVASGSTTASHDCDRLVVVSGNLKGWHCFGERAEEIQKQATSGTLTFKMKL